MHDRQPTPTDPDFEALNDSELRALLAKCQAELGRRAVVASDFEPPGVEYSAHPTISDFLPGIRLAWRRAKKRAVSPSLVFRNPSDIDLYTRTDLRALQAFYQDAASEEPDGKVYMPARVKNDL